MISNLKDKIENHSVIIIEGDIQNNTKSIHEELCQDSYDIIEIKLTKESIREFDDIVYLASVKTKVILCSIETISDVVISAMLKRIEDLRLNTKIIIISNFRLPNIMLSRGIYFIEQLTNEMSSFLHNFESKLLQVRNKKEWNIGYKTWLKLIDLNQASYLDTKEDYVQIAKDLIKYAGLVF